MKVLMLTSSYPIRGSNLGPFVKNIARGLAEQGHEVGVLIFSTGHQQNTYQDEGITIYEYPYTILTEPQLHKGRGLIPSLRGNFLAKLQLPGYFMSTAYHLIKTAKNYDIIHAHWVLPGGCIATITKPFHKKVIVTTIWGAEFYIPPTALIKKLYKSILKKSDKVVSVSNYLKSRGTDYNLDIKKIETIPNSVLLESFSPKKRKTNKIIIGTARRLVPEKRIDDLIKAFARIAKQEGIELWIAGDGPEEQKLKELTKELNLYSKIKFLGMINHKEIPEFFSRVDIYVNPSVQEGMATANIEALAAGCVVIATEGYGNEEVITNGKNGFIYPGANIEDLTKSLEKLISNKRILTDFKKEAYKTSANFSHRKIASQYVKIYEEAIIRHEEQSKK